MQRRRFTREGLRQYNGKDGAAAFVAYEGKVYDVSSSFLWQRGVHQVIHQAGTDLTDKLADAPHGPEFLSKFAVVGELQE